MINQKMQDAIVLQINKELYSAYLYLSMAAYFENKGLMGFGNWMRVQTQEEMFHAMKFFNYIIERGGMISLAKIEAPPVKWDSPLAAFKDALHHEGTITASINGLVKLAREEGDYAADMFLQWYVNEQVEEEANVGDVINKLELIGDGQGVFLLDKDLAARVFVMPTATGA